MSARRPSVLLNQMGTHTLDIGLIEELLMAWLHLLSSNCLEVKVSTWYESQDQQHQGLHSACQAVERTVANVGKLCGREQYRILYDLQETQKHPALSQVKCEKIWAGKTDCLPRVRASAFYVLVITQGHDGHAGVRPRPG